MRGLALAIGWLLFSVVGRVWAVEPLTSLPAVRALTPEQGGQRLPVRLDAVVTFYHPAWGVLFVHDGQSGICVGVPEEMRPQAGFAAGARLEIEGVAGPGEFLPVIWPSAIRAKGAGTPPVFKPISAEAIFAPALDALPVEVSAVVKGTSLADDSLVLDLQMDGWLIRALLPQPEAMQQPPWQLLERRVRVRGIVGTHFNDQRQMSGRLLFVPGLYSLTILEDSHAETPAPLVPVDGLLRVDTPARQRVRVRGVATHVMPGRGLYLRGEGGSMFVQTAQPATVARGDEVEAEGFPVVTAFRPGLSALDVKNLGPAAAPLPVEFLPGETRHSREQCELVTLEAEFLERTRTREAAVLVCRAGRQVFEASLADPLEPGADLARGMRLRLTGICELLSTRPLVIPRNATGFRLLLRGPEDVAIVARQPWWNAQRALWALGAVAILALAVGAWAVTLQMVVRSQSSVIRRQARQQAALEERERIARDLHDTLEQELVGVNMLLDSTAMHLNGAHPEAAEPLGLARRLLRRAREESRTTIRELRSVALEQRGLPAALEEFLRPLATAAGAEFRMETRGTPVRLAGTHETHLLRIGHEAVANAARHSGSKIISLLLEYRPDQVLLAISDDGRGFDPATASAEAGHFGLSGIRERTEKIGGALRLDTAPGRGCTVTVSAPVIPSSTNPMTPAT